MPTPLRNVRVDEDLWSAAIVAATEEGTDVSSVIREALEEYVDKAERRRRRRRK